MAMLKEEIASWLAALPEGVAIGVDDGGLCLCVVGEDDAYCEIGGLPEIITGECTNGCPEGTGLFCTNCGNFYCDRCYDTSEGEGCQYHLADYDPKTISMDEPLAAAVQHQDRLFEFPILVTASGELVGNDFPKRLLVRHEQTSLRIIFQADGEEANDNWPDLLIERQEDRWYMILHPHDGDPVATISIYGDHRIILEDPDDNREDVELHRENDNYCEECQRSQGPHYRGPCPH